MIMSNAENKDLNQTQSLEVGSPNSQIFISLVVPAYNEQQRLPLAIRDIRSFMTALKVSYELIVVIEKSSDESLRVAQQEITRDGEPPDPAVQIIANPTHKGKGYAVQTGMRKARGEFVFFMDADLSTPLSEILSFLSVFSSEPDTDIIIGSRALDRKKVLLRQSLPREYMGRFFNILVQWLFPLGISDTQCGFKAFRHRVVEPIFAKQKTTGFAFDVEILWIAQLMGFSIKALPVLWRNSKTSRVRVILDPISMFFDLLQIRLRHRQHSIAKSHVSK